MMLHLGHPATMARKPAVHDATRTVLSGTQPKLERLFADRFSALTKSGAFKDQPARLVDRRPVVMLPSTTTYVPERKAKKNAADKRPAYSHPGLTEDQMAWRTAYTRGEG